MHENNNDAKRYRGIAFVGNYLPRKCGIATFTHDLSCAVAKQAGEDQPVSVLAMNDQPEGYAYPERVKFELRQDHQIDYSRAADFLNFSPFDIVSLQHEYGIYGGDWGSNILVFLRNLNRRKIVTCHTVLEKPETGPKEVLREIASKADRLVVMNPNAVSVLEQTYGIPSSKIAYIPHGIHDVPFIDPHFYKDKFGVEGQRVLLTFGLLNRLKGIEYMIEALPEIIASHPNTTYVILGATHPALVQKEGESYRLSLQRRIRELGLESHVLFHPRFVDLNELIEYLGATDIFVAPYLNMEQVTSGALAYAMGTGKAVVSTPYPHAKEFLADGRGCLVPPQDHRALAREINNLLDDEIKLSSIRKRAYNYCRPMVWSEVAKQYLALMEEVRSHAPSQFPIASAMRTPIAATNLPTPKLDHVLRLCDDTGPARHAKYAVPDRSYGYSLGVTAITLVASTKFHDNYKDKEAAKLSETCLVLLQTLIGEGNYQSVAAELDYSRQRKGVATEDSVAQAIWALGYVVWKGPQYLAATAHDLIHQILPQKGFKTPRAASYAILGLCNFLEAFPGASSFKRLLVSQLEVLTQILDEPDWHENWDTEDWPIVAQAYCVASRLLDDERSYDISKKLIEQCVQITSNGTFFKKHEDNSKGDESPITCGTFIEALGASFRIDRDKALLIPMRAAVDWFLGSNRFDLPLYDFYTCGCCDALTPSGLNRNQGAKSTVYCLLAFLSLNETISIEGMDAPSPKKKDPSA